MEVLSAAITGTVGVVDLLNGLSWEFRGRHRLQSVLETFDYLALRVLYIATPDGVDVFRPVWFGVPTADGCSALPPWGGGLVRLDNMRDPYWLDTGTRWLKTILGKAVETRGTSMLDAVRLLVLSLHSFSNRAGVWINPDLLALLE